ncbi:MAG TPA: hypothetical protein PKD91_10665, partial [Bacteroidia bacterium]|nr:hypothetical protein [Bacteroidia bacterium]
VYWATGTEINNNFFNLESSSDGLNWNHLATIQGSGNSTNIRHYSFLDVNPFHSWNYYRLKQVDFDGHYTYSEIISIKMEEIVTEETELIVYPNPSYKRVVEVEVQNLKEMELMELLVINSLGEVVYQNSFHPEYSHSDNMKYEINLETGLPAGVYYIFCRNVKEELIRKLILY